MSLTPRMISAVGDALTAMANDDSEEYTPELSRKRAEEMRNAEDVIMAEKSFRPSWLATTEPERRIVDVTLELLENRIH